MKKLSMDLNLFSPRWGHEDTYKIQMDETQLTISLNMKIAKCVIEDGYDPEWPDDSLRKMMNNDSIYPAAILPDLIAHAWTEWINGELDDQQFKDEFTALGTWQNEITKTKPNTDFWKKYF